MDRRNPAYLTQYSLSVGAISKLALIPNDFSKGKLTIKSKPKLLFSDDRYVVVEIELSGRGVAFNGFAILNTFSGRYIYKDFVYDGSEVFDYFTSDDGYFAITKNLSAEDEVSISLLKFN